METKQGLDKNAIAHHIKWFVLMVTLIGGVYVMDAKIERQIAVQSARTDKLYEMFIDLVKKRHS